MFESQAWANIRIHFSVRVMIPTITNMCYSYLGQMQLFPNFASILHIKVHFSITFMSSWTNHCGAWGSTFDWGYYYLRFSPGKGTRCCGLSTWTYRVKCHIQNMRYGKVLEVSFLPLITGEFLLSMYSRLSRIFTARGSVKGGPPRV